MGRKREEKEMGTKTSVGAAVICLDYSNTAAAICIRTRTSEVVVDRQGKWGKLFT